MLFFDLRCNRCGYVFPMPLEHKSCPNCDAADDYRLRPMLKIKHAAMVVVDLWDQGSTDATLWAEAKDALRKAIE